MIFQEVLGARIPQCSLCFEHHLLVANLRFGGRGGGGWGDNQRAPGQPLSLVPVQSALGYILNWDAEVSTFLLRICSRSRSLGALPISDGIRTLLDRVLLIHIYIYIYTSIIRVIDDALQKV